MTFAAIPFTQSDLRSQKILGENLVWLFCGVKCFFAAVLSAGAGHRTTTTGREAP